MPSPRIYFVLYNCIIESYETTEELLHLFSKPLEWFPQRTHASLEDSVFELIDYCIYTERIGTLIDRFLEDKGKKRKGIKHRQKTLKNIRASSKHIAVSYTPDIPEIINIERFSRLCPQYNPIFLFKTSFTGDVKLYYSELTRILDLSFAHIVILGIPKRKNIITNDPKYKKYLLPLSIEQYWTFFSDLPTYFFLPEGNKKYWLSKIFGTRNQMINNSANKIYEYKYNEADLFSNYQDILEKNLQISFPWQQLGEQRYPMKTKLSNLEMLNGFINDFRKKILGLKIPRDWGEPSSDLNRIEQSIRKQMKHFETPNDHEDLGFWYYNTHDQEHIEKVLGILHQLIIKKNLAIPDPALYLLYIAAYGHDLGMTPWGIDLINAYEKVMGKRINTTDQFRQLHSQASAQKLDKILYHFINSDEIRGCIREISSSHSGSLNTANCINIKGIEINRPLLIALLRIADQMDAGRERLPLEDTIAKCIALASTCPEPFMNQFEHYLRRYIVLGCEMQDDGIIQLTIQKSFNQLKIDSPVIAKGAIKTTTGDKAFLGVIKEFAGELGLPQNIEYLKKTHPNLDWKDIEELKGKGVTNDLLNAVKINQIGWKIEFLGENLPIIPNAWITNAKEYRNKFDSAPHPVEKLLQ